MAAKKIVNKVMKALKWVGIVLGALVVILIIAAIALPYFLPLDKIKDIAAEKASEAIHRQVKIGKVSFNIFKGIEIKNVYIGNRPGFSKEPFISAGLIELKYNFWALLRGKIAIDKVVLVKPEILVEQRSDGTSNYGDLVGAKKPAPVKAVKKPAKQKEPISLLVSKFSIKNGKLTLNQAGKVNQLKDLNVDISGISLKTTSPIYIYVGVTGVYEGKSVPIYISGKVKLDLGKSYVRAYDFDISAAGEKLSLDAEVTNFDKAPYIKLSVSTRKLDTDKFMAILSGKPTKKPKVKPVPPPYGKQTATINKSLKSVPSNIKLDAKVSLNNILFKEMKIDSVAGTAKLSNKILNISIDGINAYKGVVHGAVTADLNVSGIAYSVKDVSAKNFDATPAANDVIESFLTNLPDYKDLKDKISGNLGFRISMTGRGVETPDIIANAKGNGSFILANGKVSKLKSLSAIGSKIGLTMFDKDMDIQEFKGNFSFANKIVNISNLALHNGDKGDVKINFDGSANIGTLAFISGNTLSLKLNPDKTKLAADYDAFKDERGWYSLDFEMTGSLKKPIPIPKLGKAINKAVDVKKKEAEQQVQKEIDKQKQELDRQKKEAEDKAKQELENKAKEMFKF